MHVAIGVLIGRILGNRILLGLLLVAVLFGLNADILGGAITNTAKGVLSPVGQWISERGATPAGKLVPTPTGGFQTGAPATATPTKGPPEATPAPTAPPPNTPTATATSAPATATPTIAPATTTATATVDTNATKIAEVRIAAETAIADARKEAATAIAETKRLVQLALTPAAAATPTATATGQPVPAPSAVTPTVTPVRAAAPPGTTPMTSPTAVKSPAPATTPSTACPASWPATAEEFLKLILEGQSASDGTWIPLALSEVHRAPDEPCSWAAKREKDLQGKIIPFWMTTKHFTACVIHDGWMHSPAERARLGRKTPATALGSGVPPNWNGLVEGVKITPDCPAGLQ